ncbi:MAG: Rrf2 family transcriptional regulator [Alphaproteobacteria bacterium]|nr:Rrf2 family transcriptional regulator [Alphaproteobacteria bacterium]MDP6517768.1 Rrf2 family transcriptional regulator [Alphaproteobacteria bacterium]
MRLSTKGRHAVAAMVDLASHDADRPVSLADIAEHQEISLSYLEQLFSRLRKGHLVRSVRGPGGGYLLSRPATEMRISEIVRAVDDVAQPVNRPDLSLDDDDCDRSRRLTLDLWRQLDQQIHSYLSSISLADVCDRRVPMAGALALEDCTPLPPTMMSPAC